MITFTGNPDDGSGSPNGYGPRLWVKFEDADTRTQTFRDLVAAFKTLSASHGPDRLFLSDDQESDARIMSWEFYSPAGDAEASSIWCWGDALAYLAKIGAKRTEDENFMEGFSQLYGFYR